MTDEGGDFSLGQGIQKSSVSLWFTRKPSTDCAPDTKGFHGHFACTMCQEHLQGLSHLFLTRRNSPCSPILWMSKTESWVGGAPESPTCKKQSWDFKPILWYLLPSLQCQPLNTPAPEQTSLAGYGVISLKNH